MTQDPFLLSYDDLQIYARQFEVGASAAVADQGISVVIDVFRASNTMLELLDAGAEVYPVMTVEDALDDKFSNYLRVGEDEGEVLSSFDYDNSPVTIHQNASQFKGRKVVIRTTNGTRGIISAVGSRKILVGTYRNMSATIDICLEFHKKGIPVSFIGMGTLEEHRIEDEYCARMFVIHMLERLGYSEIVDKLSQHDQNPWLRDWQQEIMKVRGDNLGKLDDYRFSLKLDTTDLVPEFDVKNQCLIPYTRAG